MMDAPSVPGSIALDTADISGVGGRDANEDALGSVQRGGLVCFVISDGAGGHEGGEVASRIVVRSVLDVFEQATASGTILDASMLRSCIAHAADEVARGKTGHDHLQSMNATVAVVLIDAKRREASWAHLGDTRIYLFRDGRLLHVTKDHSLAQQFIDAGLGGDTDVRNHPKRNLLYAAIGAETDVPPAVQPSVALQPGDALLVCTDGLWEWVTEDVMEECLLRAADVRAWLGTLCEAADAASATSSKTRDNFTAQAIWIHEQVKP